MAVSEAKRKSNDKYNMKCDQIVIKPLKPIGQKIRQTAKDSGKSLQAFILDAIDKQIAEMEDGENIPNEVIINSMEWLRNHGHSAEDIVDFFQYIGKEPDL